MDVMLRRRIMMAEVGGSPTPPEPPTPTITLLYENTSEITTRTDTGVKLFDPLISFTILLDATVNNYNWNTYTTRGVLGISPNNETFRLGRANDSYNMTNGVAAASTGNYYYTFSLYPSNGTKKCISLYSRNNGALRRKIAIRFNAETMKVEGISPVVNDFSKWYIADGVPVTSSTVRIDVGDIQGGTNSTVHTLKIYEGLLSDADMLAFIQ